MAARSSSGDDPKTGSAGAKGGAPKSGPVIGDAIPDMVRRMMTLGLSGFFTTEEALRKAVGDTIPRDWVDFAAGQSERTRKDFAEAVAKEVASVVENVDIADVLGTLFENRSIEVTARVRLLPRDESTGVPGAHVDQVHFDFDPDEE